MPGPDHTHRGDLQTSPSLSLQPQVTVLTIPTGRLGRNSNGSTVIHEVALCDRGHTGSSRVNPETCHEAMVRARRGFPGPILLKTGWFLTSGIPVALGEFIHGPRNGTHTWSG